MLLTETSHGPQETLPITLEHSYKDGLNCQSNCSFMSSLPTKENVAENWHNRNSQQVFFFWFFASYLLQMSIWRQRFICLCYLLYKNVLPFSMFIHAKPQGKGGEDGESPERTSIFRVPFWSITSFITWSQARAWLHYGAIGLRSLRPIYSSRSMCSD